MTAVLTGFCNPSNPTESHLRCRCDHAVHAPAPVATDPVTGLQAAAQGLEDALPGLVEACTDPQATDLAQLLYDVQAARIKLQGLERDLVDTTARAMLADEVHTDTLRVERRRASDRKAWDHEAWQRDVRAKSLQAYGLKGAQGVLTADGEVVPAEVLHRLLADVEAAHGAAAPKTTALRGLGLDPRDYCESAPGAWQVRVQRVADETESGDE